MSSGAWGGALMRSPLRGLLLALGMALAAGAGLLCASVLLGEPRWVPSTAPLRLQAEAGSAASLDRETLERVRKATGLHLGASRRLEVAELAPPVLPVEELNIRAAEPEWLQLAGLLPERGRGLLPLDEGSAAPVCLVSPRLARALPVDGDALGQRLRLDGTWLTVVGLLPAVEGALPDLVVPWRTGTQRLARGAPAPTELLVRADARGRGEALLGALARSPAGEAGWSLAQTGSAGQPAGLELTLGVLLALLLLAASACGGLALADLIPRPVTPARRLQAAALALALSVPGLVLGAPAAAWLAARLGITLAIPAVAWGLALLPGPLLSAAISPRDRAW